MIICAANPIPQGSFIGFDCKEPQAYIVLPDQWDGPRIRIMNDLAQTQEGFNWLLMWVMTMHNAV
nr:hypothetical protein [Candidatus Magasanikbacteria bacterium]